MFNTNLKNDLWLTENSTLLELLKDLLTQEYSVKNAFENKNLEQIKDTVLNSSDALDQDPSFNRVKSALILILEELQLWGFETIPFIHLSSLHSSGNNSEDDFYKVYTFFKNPSALPFSEEIRTKLLGQQLSLSIESLAQKTLHPFLSAWWPNRERSISLLLAPEKTELQLHPDLSMALNRLAILHQELLVDPVFPTQTVELSLRYILSLANEKEFVPAPIEVGYLLFFFGQQEFLERFLHNSLNIEGVEADEIVDFGFRMIRTQRLKTKTTSQISVFTKADLESLEEDYSAVYQLLSKLSTKKPAVTSEAA